MLGRGIARRLAARTGWPAPATTPLLSVVVPVYQVEAYLAACLDSVLSQTFGDLEVIVVDDGSTDRAGQIASTYAIKDRRVRVLRQANSGLGAARNAGVRVATGAYLTFLDGDDLLPRNAYATLVGTLERSGSDFAVGQIARFVDGKPQHLWWARKIHDRPRVGTRLVDYPAALRDFYTPNKVFRRETWDAVGASFREDALFEDQPLITQLYCRPGTRFDVVPDVTYLWRTRADCSSISQNLYASGPATERLRAVELTREAIDASGSEVALGAWQWTMLEFHLPQYFAGVAPEVLPTALRMLRTVVTSRDLLSVSNVSPQHRVLAWIALHRGPAAVRRYVDSVGAGQRSFPVVWRNGQGAIQLPGHDDPAIPTELFHLTPWLCAARALLVHYESPESGRLRIELRAQIDFVDPREHPTTLTLLVESGDGEPLLKVEAERRAPGSFTGLLDLNTLAFGDECSPLRVRALVRTSVQGREIAGETLLTSRHGTWPVLQRVCTAVGPSAAGAVMRADWTLGGGLELTPSYPIVQLTSAGLEGAELVLRVRTRIGTEPPMLLLRAHGRPDPMPYMVHGVAQTSSGSEFRIPLRRLKDVTTWRTEAVWSNRRAQAVALTDEVRREMLRCGIAVGLGQSGELCIIPACTSPLVTDIRLSADGLYVDGIHQGDPPQVMLRDEVSGQGVRLRPVQGPTSGRLGFAAWLPFADLPSPASWLVLYLADSPAEVAPWTATSQHVRSGPWRATLRRGSPDGVRLRIRTHEQSS